MSSAVSQFSEWCRRASRPRGGMRSPVGQTGGESGVLPAGGTTDRHETRSLDRAPLGRHPMPGATPMPLLTWVFPRRRRSVMAQANGQGVARPEDRADRLRMAE